MLQEELHAVDHAVDWLYVAVLAVLVFIAALVGNLSFGAALPPCCQQYCSWDSLF